ncbi:basic secretory family protein, partial [Trifolium pratense]
PTDQQPCRQKKRAGEGDKWDHGYDVTARFLDYCDGLRNGFVADLNKKMRNGYSDQYFVELLGKMPDQLFTDYKAKFHYSTLMAGRQLQTTYGGESGVHGSTAVQRAAADGQQSMVGATCVWYLVVLPSIF